MFICKYEMLILKLYILDITNLHGTSDKTYLHKEKDG